MLGDEDRMTPKRRLLPVALGLGWRKAPADEVPGMIENAIEPFLREIGLLLRTKVKSTSERRFPQFVKELINVLHAQLPIRTPKKGRDPAWATYKPADEISCRSGQARAKVSSLPPPFDELARRCDCVRPDSLAASTASRSNASPGSAAGSSTASSFRASFRTLSSYTSLS